MKNFKIGVVGVGRVGLVTAAGFADKGFFVYGVDKDLKKIEKLKRLEAPFYEPGLDELIKRNSDKLFFTNNLKEIIHECDILFICVGTPQREDGSADLSYVEEVSREIAQNIEKYVLIVEKSTVPVATSEWIKKIMKLYLKKNVPYDVASNPEFLREGRAVYDFMNPDRIVIGVESEKAKEILLEIYKDFNSEIVITDIKTAEIIKHASNAFLATKISFINMIADLCEKVGADVDLVAYGMGLDKRIGKEFLKAGIGYGGSCFPKDIKAFKKIGEEYKLDFSLLECVDRINSQRPYKFFEKVKEALWSVRDKVLCIWGLSFKPDTDDIREAPSIKIVKILYDEGAILNLYDPKATFNFKEIFPENQRIRYFNSAYEAAKNSHAILILTEWDEFKNIDFDKLKSLVQIPIIVDGRNIFKKEEINKRGFSYYPMGKKPCECF